MELRVRDVVANKRYKGATHKQINDMHNSHGCKSEFGVGNNRCRGQLCEDCFDTLMSNLEYRDNDIY